MNGPEPCRWGLATNGRCHSPIACAGFGYCRDRNIIDGVPDEETAAQWRVEAAHRLAIASRTDNSEAKPLMNTTVSKDGRSEA